MSHRHATHHRVPCAISPYGGHRCTIEDADLLVGKAHDATDIVIAFKVSETGAVDDITIGGIAHDTAYTSRALQGVSTIKDEISNDGM